MVHINEEKIKFKICCSASLTSIKSCICKSFLIQNYLKKSNFLRKNDSSKKIMENGQKFWENHKKQKCVHSFATLTLYKNDPATKTKIPITVKTWSCRPLNMRNLKIPRAKKSNEGLCLKQQKVWVRP